MKIKRFRDLTLIDYTLDKLLVIACDSCGGVGNKKEDLLKVPPEIVGYFTTRVALMEVLSVGAQVLAVIDTLSVEMEPTGKRIIKGIKTLLEEGKIDAISLNGSTEENFQTCQTGIGITVIGEGQKNSLKINTSYKEDYVVLLGTPKVGKEIKLPFDEEICSLKELQQLVCMKEVKEIYPIGSKGILYEANSLAQNNKLSFKTEKNLEVDIYKSAGPATALLFTTGYKDFEKIQREFKNKLQIIGKLI